MSGGFEERMTDFKRLSVGAAVILLCLTLGAPDLGAAQRSVGSAEELITLILKKWENVEKRKEKEKELPEWKKTGPRPTHARLQRLQFHGSLLIKALSDERLKHVGGIAIENSNIDGGLNFRDIPETPLDEIDLPQHWLADQRQTWLASAKAAGISGLHVVRPALRFTETFFAWSRGDFLFLNALQTLFQGKFQLRDVTFGIAQGYGEKNFRDAIFGSDVEFVNVRLFGLCNMAGAIAAGEFKFSNIKASDLLFERMRFERKAQFADLNANLNFQDATFEREASFTGDIRGISPSRSNSGAPVKMIRTHFGGPVLFRDATITGAVDMTKAVFQELVSLQRSQFLESLTINSVNVRGFLDLRDSKIQELNFRNDALTLVEGRVDFRNAEIGNLIFKDVVFANDVDFSDARFGTVSTKKEDKALSSPKSVEMPPPAAEGKDTLSTTSLRFVTFEGNVYFMRTEFFGNLFFEDVNFQKTSDFTEARLPGGGDKSKVFLFSFVRFEELLLRWGQLPPTSQWIDTQDDLPEHLAGEGRRVESISHVLGKFETLFRTNNLLSDANEAHYAAKLAELAEARREKKPIGQRFSIEAEWLLWGITCGYGTRIVPILGGAIVLCLLFALVLARCNVQRRPIPKSTSQFDLRLRLLDLPRQYLAGPLATPVGAVATVNEPATDDAQVEATDLGAKRGSNLIAALRLSAVLLFKVGYRDTIVTGKVGFLDVKYIVMFEWALGFYFLATITVTLANTQPLINKLIGGLF